jgi:large subunit ribosomal protein L3
MQFWHRKRASKETPRVRAWATTKEAKPLAFAGYKAGMTHVIATDTRKTSTSKGQDIVIPTTIIECPPMRIYSIRGYKPLGYGSAVAKEIILSVEKELERKTALPEAKGNIEDFHPEEFSKTTILIYTQPKKIGFKKKPDLFEIELGGSSKDQLTFIKEHEGKEFTVKDLFKEGDFVDVHAVTKGKGFQGPVKRFGIGLKSHKSEKGQRAPGSLGGWSGQAHVMYRVAHAGQMGYHQRTQYNNQIIKISDNPLEVNPKGGFINYGEVRNTYLLMRGTVPGPKKRVIVMTKPIRLKTTTPLPTIKIINTDSKQGR